MVVKVLGSVASGTIASVNAALATIDAFSTMIMHDPTTGTTIPTPFVYYVGGGASPWYIYVKAILLSGAANNFFKIGTSHTALLGS